MGKDAKDRRGRVPRPIALFLIWIGLGLCAGAIIASVRAALEIAAQDYLGNRMHLIALSTASLYLIRTIAVSLYVSAVLGVVHVLLHALRRNRVRSLVATLLGAVLLLIGISGFVFVVGKAMFGTFPDLYHEVLTLPEMMNWHLLPMLLSIIKVGLVKALAGIALASIVLATMAGYFAEWLIHCLVRRIPGGEYGTWNPPSGGAGPLAIAAALCLVATGALALSTSVCRIARKPQGPNVVVVSIDTLRADHLSCYGYHRPTTPRIDGLAAEGVRFDRAITPSPWTLPAHISLLTSLTPSAHKVTQVNNILSGSVILLQEKFAEAGYRTFGVVSNFLLSPVYGYDAGFEEYSFLPMADAHHVVEKAREFLGRHGREPFFLFVHLFDPHWPYRVSRENRVFGDPDSPYAERRWKNMYSFVADAMNMPEDRFRYYVDQYDNEIRFADDRIGRLFDELKSMGILDRTAVFVTADHGEEWKEHGFIGHSINLWEEVTRVPLVIRMPGAFEGGRMETEPASILDVYPTACDLAGIDVDEKIMGRSLTAADPDASSLMLSETAVGGPRHYAIWSGNLKYHSESEVKYGDFRFNRSPLLFDLAADPGEVRDLLLEDPSAAQPLRKALESYISLMQAESIGGSSEKFEMDPEMRDRLRSLGYLQ